MASADQEALLGPRTPPKRAVSPVALTSFRLTRVQRPKVIMDRLEELKSKYNTVLTLIQQQNVKLTHVHVQDNKLFIQGVAPSEEIKNNVWNEIKRVDSAYSDLTADITIDESLPKPATATTPTAASAQQTYKVQPGDSLWKISEQFLGNGAHFKKLIEANPDKLKDEHSVIHPGDELKIPAA